MTIEDRLRQAINARTRNVEPSPDALEHITNRLARETSMNLRSSPTRTRWAVAAAAAVVLIVGVVAGFAVLRDDSDPDSVDIVDRPDPDPSVPTTAGPDTTTSSSTPDTTSTPPESDPAGGALSPERQQAIWPRPSSTTTFDTPEAAARSYALYYAFFQDPLVGTFVATAGSSGEVPVQAVSGGSETRVLVRQLADGKWYVTGSLAPDITLTDPAALSSLVCPRQPLNGTALAFEGHVNVRIDAYQPDGDRVQLGSGYVTGSGSPPAIPFTGGIDCTYPTDVVEGYVVLTLWEESAASPPETTGTLQVLSIPLALPG